MKVEMTLGRFKLWLAPKEVNRKLFWVDYVFWLIPKKPDLSYVIQETFHHFHSRKQIKYEKASGMWKKIDSGFITYRISRLCFTIQTPKYHKYNPWKVVNTEI